LKDEGRAWLEMTGIQTGEMMTTLIERILT
jgi:hypothetical protein